MSQLVNAEVNSVVVIAVLAPNYTLQVRICECHASADDLKVTKHYYCIWLFLDSKYKSY